MVGFKDIPDKSIDCVIMDPPYGLNKDIVGDESLDIYYKSLIQCYRVMKDDSFLATFISIKKIQEMFLHNPFEYVWMFIVNTPSSSTRAPFGFNVYMPVLIFRKGDKKRNECIRDTDYLYYEMGHKDVHPTQKKPETFYKLIRTLTKEGDTVLDPFAGTGPVGVECKLLNRNYIGFEIDSYYAEYANEQIKNTNLSNKLW